MPPRAPVLLAMKGHPGVGKSTLATALARELRSAAGVAAAVVAKDDVREALDEACGAGHPPPPWLNAASNDAVGRAAATALACGGVDVVILDTTLSDEAALVRLVGRAGAVGVGNVVVVEVMLLGCRDDSEWAARLRGRPAHKPATVAAARALIAGYDGRDGWAAARAGGGDGGGEPVGAATPLPLPWAAAGVADRTDAGFYVRVNSGAGVGAAVLAEEVVARLRECGVVGA